MEKCQQSHQYQDAQSIRMKTTEKMRRQGTRNREISRRRERGEEREKEKEKGEREQMV